ncbi:MAG: phosphoribosyl-AMP cyclohydrolase [Rhodobiaceae bacterium]|nr:phosphoribosyl-AMP cyclohydrolase [Rhodobiaceae bacterium]
MDAIFPVAASKEALEDGDRLTPRFDDQGLIGCIAVRCGTGEVLMFAWMNAEALALTLETGIAHYWSRSRQSLWKKGETSGQIQTVKRMRVDCDQDVVLIEVEVGGDGGACHTGRPTCFYREVGIGDPAARLRSVPGLDKS